MNAVETQGGQRSRRPVLPLNWETAAIVGVVLAALVLRVLTAGHFWTVDETNWMERSDNFAAAIAAGDFDAASATTDQLATMPGVTTMWLGSLAHVAWSFGDSVGLWSTEGTAFARSSIGLHLGQIAVAVTSALLIGLIVVLARRWAGPVVALTTGVVLATEPFLVAHGAVLHTDELAALFGAAGVLALLLVLEIPAGIPRSSPQAIRHPRVLAVMAGSLLAAAFLTKLSALSLAPGVVALLAFAVWRKMRDGHDNAGPRTIAGLFTTVALVAGVGVATILLLWPAAAVDPLRQLDLLRESAEQSELPHRNFFLGEMTTKPGDLFYFVATPLRMTPWLFVATILCVPVAFVDRRRRHQALCMLIVSAPLLVVMSLAVRKFDRYVISALPFLAVVVGLGVAQFVAWPARRGISPRRLAIGGTAIAVGTAVYSLTVVPWGLAYYNPLLGGGSTAEQALLVGWGEGTEHFAEIIADREAGHCDEIVVILLYNEIPLSCGHGQRLDNTDLDDADYLLVYVNWRQRLSDRKYARLTDQGRLVSRLTVRGIDYGELYALDEPPREPDGVVGPG